MLNVNHFSVKDSKYSCQSKVRIFNIFALTYLVKCVCVCDMYIYVCMYESDDHVCG